MDCSQLNEIYRILDQKARELSRFLNSSFAYYNGHYHKNEVGEYEMSCFPIPVLSLKGICDIEIDLDNVSVTTKLSRDSVLSYNFEKINSYSFEICGVENYLNDFYVAGDTISEMKEKIKGSKEENFFFSFSFPFDVSFDVVGKFVRFLNSEGFFY